MTTRSTVESFSFEPLEPRRLLNNHLDFTLYYPEGFAHGGISEFVPITNPNDQAVEFELHARYQTGERDQLVASGTILPNTRGGVTISRAGRPEEALVRRSKAYSLVLKTSLPVSATMSHYDFATAVGESFTDQTSTVWSFGDLIKETGDAKDFIVFYNPTDSAVQVTLRGYREDGTQFTLVQTVQAQRRGGWNIDEEPGVPQGRFGAVVTATAPIVAAISHYRVLSGRGYGALGQPDSGTITGIVTALDFSNDRGYGTLPQDENPLPAEATLSFLNSGNQEATVVLRFIEHDGGGDDLRPPFTVRVAPGTRVTVELADFNFPESTLYGVLYRSDLPIVAHGVVDEGRDGTGVVGATLAATEWDFAEGFMNQSRAGGDITEDLLLFNPTNQAVNVTITFMTGRGVVININRTLAALEIRDLRIHELPEIRDLQNQVFYGIHITADDPIVATMEHWDRDLGGGFSYLGIPRGDVFDLNDVLVT